MKAQTLGIPYMGSKRKLAQDILFEITQRHIGITDFYDLFGGGGSISFTAVRDYRFKVHYNELNSHIFKLVEYLKSNSTLEDRFYDWVTRDDFFRQIEKPNSEADWYSGFVMSCWSFGNSQSSYLYGADIENIKRLAHEFIVNLNKNSLHLLGINELDLTNIKNIQDRRLAFCAYIKRNKTILQDNRVQNLELVEHLTRLQNLQITNKSYEDIKINGGNPIVYCDIPYKGTGEYKEGGFNHDKFYKWFSDLPCPAYMSEYNAPFECIKELKHRSSLSATNNKKKVVERIFWNGKGNFTNNKLF